MKSLVALIGMVLLAAGPATLLAPEAAAHAFGVSADSPDARVYLLATATRDVALGSWLLALLRLGVNERVLGVSLFAIGIVAVGDATNVIMHAGLGQGLAIAVHLGGVALLGVLGIWLWRAGSV